MASLAKGYTQKKLLGQVYTPLWIVRKILDEVGFVGDVVLGKQILDPACGDGRFLLEVAKRIIEASPIENLRENLEYIHGWDIEEDAVALCIQNLNALVAPFGVVVDWKITAKDAIRQLPPAPAASQAFDFIVGNPPYIRIQHLEEAQRGFIQQHFQFCQNGSTDIYIAFYELALHLLSDHGSAGFITPNTFLFTQTGRVLRSHFQSRQNLIRVTNYGASQLFENATTYSAVVIFDKRKKDSFTYHLAQNQQVLKTQEVFFENLSAHKTWSFVTASQHDGNGRRLGDICKIHVGITTLCDRAYIFPIEELDENFALAKTKLMGDVKIERSILKPIIKGSTLKTSQDPIREYVLFPYQKENGKNQIIKENDLAKRFPNAYAYLKSLRSELDKRDNGRPNPVAWYAFGRSQGLETSFGKKIVFSPMNLRPNFILHENEGCTLYSGYCIKYEGDYVALLSKLNSPEMQAFVQSSSRDFRNGWKAYNKRILEEFVVEI